MTYDPNSPRDTDSRQRARDLRADSTGISMSMGIIFAVLCAVLVVGGMFYMFAGDRADTTATSPAVERSAPPPTTGQGGTKAPASK
jgi:hypothetical protein